MRRRLQTAAAALAFSVLAMPAAAEGWSIMDFGEMPDRNSCLNKARAVISRYIFAHGGGETASESWTIYGYDLEPGDQDAVILCPVVSGGVINAFLTLHGETTPEERVFTAEELESYWKE